MAGVTFKCPSCGSSLVFNPDDQHWKCDHCDTTYDEKTLLAKAEAYQQEADAEHAQQAAQAAREQAEAAAREQAEGAEGGGTQVTYHCPSCGSEIMTDETTVATHCYYCHNPVVLAGKLTADMKPEQVLPFTISQENAVKQFLAWVAKKRFVPGGFFAHEQVRKMQGVYYPHFVSEYTMDGSFDGQAQRSTVFDEGQYIVTSTDHYHIVRRANLRFANVMRPALKSTDRKLSDGIHPFPLHELKPFSGAYLSGFLAERRDLSEAEATKDVQAELEGYVQPMLTQSVSIPIVSGNASARTLAKKSRYVLLPTWVLTYPKSGEKEPYYYVMNGRTGTVCGKLPINKGKLWLYGLGLAAVCYTVYCVAAYFLF